METPPPLPSNKQPKGSPAIAMLVALLPSIVWLSIITLVPDSKLSALLCLSVFVFSFVCCLISSFLMIKRMTALAMISAIVLLLLNFFISASSGCAALSFFAR